MLKEPLHNRVLKEIISLILAGVYNNGQKLPSERTLCKKLSVSRGTIRLALGDLQKLGIIVVRPNSGAYVQKISQKSLPGQFLPSEFNRVLLEDVITARLTIELKTIELACQKISKKQLQHLHEIVNRMAEQIESLPEFLNYDYEFHVAVVKAGGNAVLATAFEAIYEYHKFSQVFTSRDAEDEQVALAQHRKILAALEQKNSSLSRRRLAQHLNQTIQ